MTRACSTCSGAIHGSNRKGVCMTCQLAATCSDCAKPISLRSDGGRCRTCANQYLNSDPVLRAKKRETMKRVYADPIVAAQRAERSRLAAKKRLEKPGERERLSAWGREVGAKNIAAAHTPEARAKAGRAISAAHLAHVPSAYRALYRDLKRQNLLASERLRLVLEQQEADRRNAGRDVAAADAAMQAKHQRDLASRY